MSTRKLLKRLDQPAGKTAASIITAVLLASSIFVALSLALGGTFSHDEHQFVASGELLARYGLLPYVDYPYHHTPNMVFIYAVLQSFSSYSLLPARLFSAACLVLSTILLASLARRLAGDAASLRSYLYSLVACGLFLLNPLTGYTAARAWNHDFPLVLTLLAAWIMLVYCRENDQRWSLLIAALAIGMAIGSRLSYAVFLFPLTVYLVMLRRRAALRLLNQPLILSLLGLSLGLSPWLYLSIRAPIGSIFGNFIYPRLSHTYFIMVDNPVAMTFLGKVSYMLERMTVSPSLGVLGLTTLAALALFALSGAKRPVLERPLELFAFLGLGSALAGSLAPTPSWFQYFYGCVPFALLAVIAVIGGLPPAKRSAGVMLGALLIAALLLAVWSSPLQEYTRSLTRKDTNVPLAVHTLGLELAEDLGAGKVLTLAPIIPLEGGLEIYPAFATGAFTWRVAVLLGPDLRDRYQITSFQELNSYLEDDQPIAILTGFELENPGLRFLDKGGLERPLEAYAEARGYRLHPLTAVLGYSPRLWVRK